MQSEADYNAKVQEIVERITGRPAYAATDEEWAEALEEASLPHPPPIGPNCPHCGELAPHGDARIPWLGWHIDSHIHRWWWGFKKWRKR